MSPTTATASPAAPPPHVASRERPRDEESFATLPPVSGLEPFDRQSFRDLQRPVAYLANGLIGLRLPAIPFQGGVAAVNGYVGRSIGDGHETQAPAPNPIGADLISGGVRLSEQPDRVEMHRQSLSMSHGELTTRFTLHTEAGRLGVEVLTFACRHMPSVCCQEITVTPDYDGAVELEAIMDPRQLPGTCKQRFMLDNDLDAVLWWEGRGGLSSVGAGFATELLDAEPTRSRRNDWGNESLLCLRAYQCDLKPGQSVRLRQYGVLVPSAMEAEPQTHAFHILRFAQRIGFDRLRHEHQKAWAELWRARPIVHGIDANLQRQIDSAFFYLHASAHRATPCGIAPFGLSQTEGYYDGHSFTQDTEIYMFPPLVLSDPGAARALINYRHRQREAAHQFALLLGYDGLFYPNQTGLFGGIATRPSAGQAIDGATHANHFVADAVMQYLHATGDEDALREVGWPIVRGIADWCATRVTRTERGCEVRNIQLNHHYANTHNEPPVNRAFQRVLRAAAELAERLGKRGAPRWTEVAEDMLILTDEADLRRETAWFEPNYKAFERATNWDELLRDADGLSGQCISSIRPMFSALKLGYRDFAAERWPYEVGLHYDADNFGLWTERTGTWGELSWTPPMDQACFVTFPGHMIKQLLIQFPRLAFSFDAPETWPEADVALPTGWEAIEVERVWARDEPMRLVAEQGRKTKLERR